jgi:hypothetical protein
VLADYPDEIIAHITDPRTGVQRQCKWPPTIAEIVTACEVRMQHMAKLKRLDNWGRSAVPAIEAPREARPTYDELKEKYGENFGLKPVEAPKKEKFKPPSWDQIICRYQADPTRLAKLIKAANDMGNQS